MDETIKPKTTSGNRGKVAERLVKSYLKSKEKYATIAHHKFADAYAGFRSAAPCDFMVMCSGSMFVLEVKETKHDFRLPKANFKLEQIARMRMWGSAGARAYVIIYHSTSKCWRVCAVDWFLDLSAGSWDLTPLPTYLSITELMDAILGIRNEK